MANQGIRQQWNRLWAEVEKTRTALETAMDPEVAIPNSNAYVDFRDVVEPPPITVVGGNRGQAPEQDLTTKPTDKQSVEAAKASFQTAVKQWFNSVAKEV